MKKSLLALTTLFLVGCIATPASLPSNQAAKIEPKQTTSIFYYPVAPVGHGQATALVTGTFAWKAGCLYLVGKDGVYHTAMFPMYPKGLVQWDEASKTITLDGHDFKMGDFISTNGHYSDYVANSPMGLEYQNQGNKKCLNPSIANIGTMDLND